MRTDQNPSAYTEYFRQEVVQSAKNLFSSAVNALKTKPSLKKVVIMKQIPRYDPLSVDPLSLKPVLSQLFNSTLTDLWMNCLHKDKIFIGNHNLDCTGAIKESRYRESRTGRYDGVHLIGNSGKISYTKSVLNILSMAGVTDQDYEFHKSCPQVKHNQNRKNTQFGRSNAATGHTGTGGRHTQSRRDVSGTHRCYSVPTANRFETFATHNQGNY